MSKPQAKTTEEAMLLALEEKEVEERREKRSGARKLRMVNREQRAMVPLDVEELIGAEDKARAIWELTGKLDLSRFEEPIRTIEGEAGRAAWDPRLLVSIWVWAYSEGIGSAREIARLLEHEPALRWLAGLEVINHHTLSDFRVQQREALEELFARLLAVLQQEGMIRLERVMHDGTKVRAQAGSNTFRRKKTLQEHLAEARQAVAEMGEPQQEGRGRREAAQQRAKRERLERLEQAIEQLERVEQGKPKTEEKEKVRVSWSEPEARIMKHADGAMAPSYNVQITTDAAAKAIVAVELSQCSSDGGLLPGALQAVEKNTGRQPAQVVADGGYTSEATVKALAKEEIDFIGSLPDRRAKAAAALKACGIDAAFGPERFGGDEATHTLVCPAGQSLPYVGQSQKRGRRYGQYQAAGSDCAACQFRAQCCPRAGPRGRTVSRLQQENPVMAAFREKMATAEAQQIYRQRGEVAEFPNAWLKDKFGLRKFSVRGIGKAGTEAVWACLTYNVMLWIRSVWKKGLAMNAA